MLRPGVKAMLSRVPFKRERRRSARTATAQLGSRKRKKRMLNNFDVLREPFAHATSDPLYTCVYTAESIRPPLSMRQQQPVITKCPHALPAPPRVTTAPASAPLSSSAVLSGRQTALASFVPRYPVSTNRRRQRKVPSVWWSRRLASQRSQCCPDSVADS